MLFGTFHHGFTITSAMRAAKNGVRVLLANDSLHRQYRTIAFDHLEAERGNVDDDVALAEVLWHPAPALHVHGDLPHAILGGDVQLAQRLSPDDAVVRDAMVRLKVPYERLELRVEQRAVVR